METSNIGRIGKILAIGDLHFKLSNTEESELLVKNLIEIVKRVTPDIIVILGDTLHDHANIRLYPFMRAVDFIIQLSSFARVFLLIGNHDRPNHKVFMTEEHPFNALKRIPGIFVVDKTYIEYPLVFVPYVETGRFKEAIKDVDLNKTKIVFAHQEFMNSVMKDRGDPWPEDFPLVISGHIHSEMKLQENLLYIGTPMKHSFYENSSNCVYLISEDNDNIIINKIDTQVPDKKLIRIREEDLNNTLTEISQDKSNSKYLIIVESSIKLKEEQYSNNIKILYKPCKNTPNNNTLRTSSRPFKSFISRVEEKIIGNQEFIKILDEVKKNIC
jgi:DNA repair exonuclease SbcCD nuclease subunit